MSLERLDGENFTSWKYRLIEDKLTGVINDDWQDIVEVLNLNVHRDTLRKGSIFFLEMKEYFEKKFKDGLNNEQLDEMKQLEKELFKLKVQISDERREVRKYMTHEARLDKLLKKLLDEVKDDLNNSKPLLREKQNVEFDGDTALTLMLSDLHYGMVTDNHWNKFNKEIFVERMNKTISDVIKYQAITGAKELHIMQLGDLIEGNLHRLTKLGETEDAVTQTKNVAELLSELVSILSAYFETVKVYSVKGNHDRTSSRKEEEIKTESFHEFIPWYMEMRLHDLDNVEFMKNTYDDEIIVADILGNKYFGIHGHLERGYANVIQNLTMMIKEFPTAVLAGHIHKNFENEVHEIDLIVNGGFAGTNNYAKDGRLTSKAHQKLLWLDKDGRKGTFYIKY